MSFVVKIFQIESWEFWPCKLDSDYPCLIYDSKLDYSTLTENLIQWDKKDFKKLLWLVLNIKAQLHNGSVKDIS